MSSRRSGEERKSGSKPRTPRLREASVVVGRRASVAAKVAVEKAPRVVSFGHTFTATFNLDDAKLTAAEAADPLLVDRVCADPMEAYRLLADAYEARRLSGWTHAETMAELQELAGLPAGWLGARAYVGSFAPGWQLRTAWALAWILLLAEFSFVLALWVTTDARDTVGIALRAMAAAFFVEPIAGLIVKAIALMFLQLALSRAVKRRLRRDKKLERARSLKRRAQFFSEMQRARSRARFRGMGESLSESLGRIGNRLNNLLSFSRGRRRKEPTITRSRRNLVAAVNATTATNRMRKPDGAEVAAADVDVEVRVEQPGTSGPLAAAPPPAFDLSLMGDSVSKLHELSTTHANREAIFEPTTRLRAADGALNLEP